MISRLSGIVAYRQGMEVVIDCHGVGYAVSVPLSTMDYVPPVGESVTLHTILAVREDALQLFGFSNEAERDAFRLLTSIQGIGGRTALGILSSIALDSLRSAISSGNLISLQRLPGIGKKTAERMVIELRDKIFAIAGTPPETTAMGVTSQVFADAVNALQALGYTRIAAEKAVKQVLSASADASSITSEGLIKAALRQPS
ncbi:MAG: Holliday junction branch migration protein RuvA [Ignavibacteria bacterium]|nr:Holliday junction branch migration protein RuvA [Ignavibacteria bacterium]